MQLPEDWRAFIESLNSSEVEYLVVGAVALAYHGRPRYTGDLDILVSNTPENAQRLEAVLASFGFGPPGLKAADFVDSYRVIQLGRPPNRIDLLTSITGVPFDEAWAGRVEREIAGVRVHRATGADPEQEIHGALPGLRRSGSARGRRIIPGRPATQQAARRRVYGSQHKPLRPGSAPVRLWDFAVRNRTHPRSSVALILP